MASIGNLFAVTVKFNSSKYSMISLKGTPEILNFLTGILSVSIAALPAIFSPSTANKVSTFSLPSSRRKAQGSKRSGGILKHILGEKFVQGAALFQGEGDFAGEVAFMKMEFLFHAMVVKVLLCKITATAAACGRVE